MKLPAILVKFSSYRLCILQKFVWVRFPPPQKKTRQPPSPKETHDFRWMIRELYRKKNLPKKKKNPRRWRPRRIGGHPKLRSRAQGSLRSFQMISGLGFRVYLAILFWGGCWIIKIRHPPPKSKTSWWLNHPSDFFFLNLDHLPRARGENRQHFKPRPRIVKVNPLSQGKERPGPCEPAKKKTSYFPFNPGSLIGILYYFMVSYGPHLIV